MAEGKLRLWSHCGVQKVCTWLIRFHVIFFFTPSSFLTSTCLEISCRQTKSYDGAIWYQPYHNEVPDYRSPICVRHVTWVVQFFRGLLGDITHYSSSWDEEFEVPQSWWVWESWVVDRSGFYLRQSNALPKFATTRQNCTTETYLIDTIGRILIRVG